MSHWNDGALLTTTSVARVLQVSKSGVIWLAESGRLAVHSRTVTGTRLFQWGTVREFATARARARVQRFTEVRVVVARSPQLRLPLHMARPELPRRAVKMAKASLYQGAVNRRRSASNSRR